MKQRTNKATFKAEHWIGWIYGAVVTTALIAVSLFESGDATVASLCIDVVLLVGFLAAASRVGLWSRTDPPHQRSPSPRSHETSCHQAIGG